MDIIQRLNPTLVRESGGAKQPPSRQVPAGPSGRAHGQRGEGPISAALAAGFEWHCLKSKMASQQGQIVKEGHSLLDY